MENINWEEIQLFYNDGNTIKQTSEKFNIPEGYLYKGSKLGFIKIRNKSEAMSVMFSKNIRTLSEESKRKISESRKKYLLENPDKVPYKLNHSSKESYPEKYFTELFEKEKIKVEKSFRIGLYELDFCILDKKIDIEIDGEQHYLDKKITKSDIKRTKYLEENGWDIIRIRWSDYKKMSFIEKSNYISEFKKYVEKIINEKPTVKFIRVHKKHGVDICECGKEKSKKSKKCSICQHIKYRKTERPPYDQLLKEIEESNYTAVGRKYGVSDNTIRKWIKYYEKYDQQTVY
jgi:very-short-patch-repair endonuclease/glycerol-3-phosphate cytidylyltransferase-like family protein